MAKRTAELAGLEPSAQDEQDVKEEAEEDDEIEEVSMHIVVAEQACKDENPGKPGKPGKPRKRPKGIKKPKLPQFAFEWFRQKTRETEEKEPALAEMVARWKQLPEEGRAHYIGLAEHDRRRFEMQYEEWREARSKQGKADPLWKDLLEKRRASLEKCLTRVESAGKQAAKKRKEPPPPGFPKPAVRSAYALFCAEQKAKKEDEPGHEAVPKKGAYLCALRKAWNELADEEKRSCAERAAEDQQRFREELQAWRSDPNNEELAGTSRVQALMEPGRTRKPKNLKTKGVLPKPRLKRQEVIARPESKEEIFFDVLTGTQVMAAKERAAAAKERKQNPKPSQAREAPKEIEAPDTTVDDLLGDLLAVEEEAVEEPTGNVSAFGNDAPQASVGPQLCLDESGNIVLNQSSLSRSMESQAPLEEASEVHEAVCQYVNAYRKTPVCKWTADETELFYEALSLYGTDLFLVQTFFRNKSAGQIKTKYSKEVKKNPKKVEEALTDKAKRLTKDAFEKLHGKIDISKHYQPPPSPQPGEEAPEPPPEEEDPDLGGMPPPEPEFCAEDESLTTNRLMALFD